MGRHARIDDHDALLCLFRKLAGRRLVGVVDGGVGEWVELVFDDPDGQGDNLVSIDTSGPHVGWVSLGFVCQAYIDEGYGAPEPADDAEPAR